MHSNNTKSPGSEQLVSVGHWQVNLTLYLLFGVLRRFQHCIYYLGFYVAFNTVQVISRWVVGRAVHTVGQGSVL